MLLAKAGDREAIAELVQRYERVAIMTAWGILADFHQAQDTVQEAFVHALMSLEKLDDPACFGGWFLTSVKRRAMRAKSKRCETNIDPSQVQVAATEDQPRAYDDLIQLLGRLPEQEHQVICLRYIQSMSVRQISFAIGRPVGTVTKQLSRGIKRLREMFVRLDS